jgi:hypothetical protein
MQDFAARIQDRYPDGLTGIFAIGGTRTTYILEQNRMKDDPGRIENFAEHGAYLQQRYMDFARMFFGLGGRNMIITASSFRGFTERGEEYAQLVNKEILRLIDDHFQAFYRDEHIDPYFIGIDPFLHLPAETPAHQMALAIQQFQQQWPYDPSHKRLIWEIASIPLYTLWQMFQTMTPEARAALDARLAQVTKLDDMHTMLYQHFAREIYGVDIPMPHFYLGTNKSGDLKWRSPMPIFLSGGEYMRMFYTPYPTLFITPDTMQAILEDLAFGKRLYSVKTDYKGRYTSELAQQEYERIELLSRDPDTTIGFSRKVAAQD